MHINLLWWAVSWAILVLVILSLVLYRRSVSSREDDSIHLEGNVPTEQVALDHRLATIDRWGKTLTVITVAYGLVLAGIYCYQVWTAVPTY